MRQNREGARCDLCWFVGAVRMVLSGIVAILVCMRDVDLIEKLTGFVRSLYERIRDWEFRHPWITRLFWYFALLVVVLSVCHQAFNYFNLYHTDADSARYMLSAMVQAQAAIIAIIITLPLIAIQLTASAYSPFAIRIFKNDLDMWLLLSFYGVSMMYGLIVLKMMGGVAGVAVSQDVFWVLGFIPLSIECCVSVAYWFGAFTFVGLFPYMLNIIDLLKPATIIKKLFNTITKNENLEYVSSLVKREKYPKQRIKKCPAQPIMDMISDMLRKDDIETVRDGLATVTDWAEEVTEQIGDNDDPHVKSELFSADFCKHLVRFAKLSANRDNEEAVIEIIDKLETFAYSTAQKRLDGATMTVIDSLKHIKQIVGEMEWKKATECIIWSLGMTGNYAVGFEAEQMRRKGTEQVVKSLTSIGKIATEKGFELAILQAAQFIAFVGIDATQRDQLKNSRSLEDIVLQAAQSLATLTDLRKGVKKAIECLKPTVSKEGKDEAFQSFMELYEQELEKRW